MKTTLLWLLISVSLTAQTQQLTRRDTLRGHNGPTRAAYDVLRYDLHIVPDIDAQTLKGSNQITFNAVQDFSEIQIDLFANMNVDSIIWRNKRLDYTRDFDAVLVRFPQQMAKGSTDSLTFYYSGKPIAAKHAPWDGGFVWSRDARNKPFVGVAVQGVGASLWFPLKDSQFDEPDLGAGVTIDVSSDLVAVSNGRLVETSDIGHGKRRWKWNVQYPINSYNITLNIGDYERVSDQYNTLSLDYYVLRGHAEKAKEHFAEVKPMLACFEQKFGGYPFPKDGFKIVEAPFLGMEHQSAIAYGNDFRKGYFGSDPSGTGIGLSFDFITIHESAHEWFGNSITSKDIADMWIHEGFTTYAESVFIACTQSYENALAYLNGQRRNIKNDAPITGLYGLAREGSTDMYNKGAWLVHTLRFIVNDDEKWWEILKGFSETFARSLVDKNQVIDYFNNATGQNLNAIFNHYLHRADIPVLEVCRKSKTIRWRNTTADFNLPVQLESRGKSVRLVPSGQRIKLDVTSLKNVRFRTDLALFDVVYAD